MGTLARRLLDAWHRADIAVFHEFRAPPYGGGNQFLLALCREWERRGLRLSPNRYARGVRACLCNSFNFAFDAVCNRPRRCRLVHRVDGPVGVYRGTDDETDRRIWQLNHDLADATIFQSRYSLEKHRELGMEFRNPRVIRNAADPAVFHPRGRVAFDPSRKIRLISTSWSDNPNKGAGTYKWIEDHVDRERYTYTFVGRSPVAFDWIRTLPPLPSEALADELRQHDIYITASRHDPCSNALIEALSCGLPALCLDSGGHPEIVGEGGLTFQHPEQIPSLLDALVVRYAQFQETIAVPTLANTADRYLDAMGIERPAPNGEALP